MATLATAPAAAAAASPILGELKFFMQCVSSPLKLPADVAEKLVKCSLHLLHELPSAREMVFEYFAMSFDVSVGVHMQFVEKEPNGTAPEDDTIADIQDALESLVNGGPHAWAPLISSWALRLLGTLSRKFSRGRQMDIGSACTLWLGSSAMRCLVGLAASCFGKLHSDETEECIASLLSTYVQNSPHFDWVVARLGGCFPLKVISKILQCGLKGFVGNFNSTLDSEVGILGYLSFAHELDLKYAFREMLEAVLTPTQAPTSASPAASTIPYLMHLSSMSEILLQTIVQVFIELFHVNLIPTLVAQSAHWPNAAAIKPTLAALALKLKANATHSVLTVARIADAFPWCLDLLEAVLHELEYMVLENSTCALLQDLGRTESAQLLWTACCSAQIIEQQTAVRLLLFAGHQSPHLYRQTVAELLTYRFGAAAAAAPPTTTTRRRSSSSGAASTDGAGALIRLLSPPLGTTEPTHIQGAIELALDGVLLRIDRGGAEDRRREANVLENVLMLVRLERQRSTLYLEGQEVSRTLVVSVAKLLQIWSVYLQKKMRLLETAEPLMEAAEDEDADADANGGREKRMKMRRDSADGVEEEEDNDDDDESRSGAIVYGKQIHTLAKLLDALEVGGAEPKLKFPEIVKLCQLTVKYFFWSLIETDSFILFNATDRAFRMLQRQCTARKSSRTVALRELLEGALFLYGNLFGAHHDYDQQTATDMPVQHQPHQHQPRRSDGTADEPLLKANQRHGGHPAMLRRVRKEKPAAAAPSPPPPPPSHALRPNAERQDLFLAALAACCKSDDRTRSIDGYATVALLLVELVSTDVMYNGLPWPDEEQLNKVTMERDLQIRRTFRNAPILWSILGLVAGHRPALCYTSVLLRALCASALYQWRSQSVDRGQRTAVDSELFAVTQRTLQIMSMGQLLPAPLNALHTLVEHLEPVEIAIVLKECVWNYMREHVPAPVLFGVDAAGLHWRDPVTARPPAHFVDPLRNIMQCKLPRLGAFYHHMFVMAELSGAEGTTVTTTTTA